MKEKLLHKKIDNSEKTIHGNTTFKELLDLEVKKKDIEKTISDKLPDSNMLIKEYATTKTVGFGSIKEPLQKLVDALEK
ncbi:hypothetical protein [Acetivibrio cellulolyticus]|uniref:hypothetical protein n=1 Tax=Acetivibrio cellulolyticus TaxID=35830 RepID=UPI0001E2CC91|nr:hypothetical protein [Acetivibrio cellulolyticus]